MKDNIEDNTKFKIAFCHEGGRSHSVRRLKILQDIDHSTYIVAEKYENVWRIYEKIIQFALFPVWVARPLTFNLINLYGNLAQFSVGSLILCHHLFLMWCYFIGFSFISSCIAALKRFKGITKKYFGTELEAQEIIQWKLMRKSRSYDEWLAHVGKYESAKRAPFLLQPRDKSLISDWRSNVSELRLGRKFSSRVRGVRTPIPDIDISTPKRITKVTPSRNVVGLSISEWRKFPLMETFHPHLESFNSITNRLKLLLNNLRSILPRLLKGDITGNVEDKIVSNIKIILSGITEWSVTKVGNPDLLYGVTYFGSHVKIEEQYQLVVMLLNEMNDLFNQLEEHEILDKASLLRLCKSILSPLKSTKKTFGLTALALSGGGRLAFNHIGVLDTLKQADCIPKVISGSSGGSILASTFCCLGEEEYQEMMQKVGGLCRGLIPSLKNQMKNRSLHGYNLDYLDLALTLRSILKDMTFEEVMIKTGYVLCINVTPANLKSGLRCPLLLNAYTTPNVIVWSGALASCCLPILLPPVRLLTKQTCTKILPRGSNGEIIIDSDSVFVPGDTEYITSDSYVYYLLDGKYDSDMVVKIPTHIEDDDTSYEYITGKLYSPYAPTSMRWCDGSLSNDIPIKELQRLLGAKEIIASQVNPHHAYFLNCSSHEEQYSMLSGQSLESALYATKKFCEMGVRQRYNMATSVLLSPYIDGQDITEFFSELGIGTINISPCAMHDLHKVAQAPLDEELEIAFNLAKRRTWPHIGRIRSRMRIEQALNNVEKELNEIINRCIYTI